MIVDQDGNFKMVPKAVTQIKAAGRALGKHVNDKMITAMDHFPTPEEAKEIFRKMRERGLLR